MMNKIVLEEFVSGLSFTLMGVSIYNYNDYKLVCWVLFLLGIAFVVGGVIDFIDERKSL